MKKRAPAASYVSFTTFMDALNGISSHGLPTKVDHSVFPSFSGVVKSQLLVTFRFLALINGDGIPQPAFEELVSGDTEKRKKILGDILKRQYHKLFNANLKKITPSQFDQLIEEYGVSGATKIKAKSFFLNAARWSEIEMSPLLGRKTRVTKRRRSRRRTQKKSPVSTASPPPQEQNEGERYSKSIVLPVAGGTLTLSGTFDPFLLRDKERKLVYEITDMMTTFAEGDQ